MMGHRERIKHNDEALGINRYCRTIYCFLDNHSPVHKIKKGLSRRNRHIEKQKLKQDIYI